MDGWRVRGLAENRKQESEKTGFAKHPHCQTSKLLQGKAFGHDRKTIERRRSEGRGQESEVRRQKSEDRELEKAEG